jgi:hypothetical protein
MEIRLSGKCDAMRVKTYYSLKSPPCSCVSITLPHEMLTAFLELAAAIAATANVEETTWQTPEPWASEGLAKANLLHYLFRI